jgi:hypothetical protein
LDAVESAFGLLTVGPRPLAVHGRAVGSTLPHRRILLDELRAILLHPATRQRCRDAAWRLIVRRARDGEAAWVVGAAGVALPGLRKIAQGLCDGASHDCEDVDAAVLAGFVGALHRIDADRPGVFPRLRWAAYRAGLLAAYTREDLPPVRVPAGESAPPPYPWGHPDLLLADAVAKRVLSPLQAELIGRSRLEAVPLQQVADDLEISRGAAYKARRRGEARLVTAMSAGEVEIRLSNPGTKTGLTTQEARDPEPAAERDRTGRSPASRNAGTGRLHQEGGRSGPARRSHPAQPHHTKPDRAQPDRSRSDRTRSRSARPGPVRPPRPHEGGR